MTCWTWDLQVDLRNYLSAYTNGLTNGVCQFCRARLDDLPMDLVCVSPVILEHANDFFKIQVSRRVWFT